MVEKYIHPLIKNWLHMLMEITNNEIRKQKKYKDDDCFQEIQLLGFFF